MNTLIDFETAREIVAAHERPLYQEGTFMVAPYGWEDPLHYVIVAGVREWLVDYNPDFFPPTNDRCILVDKMTGAVKIVNPAMTDTLVKLSNMTPIGEHPEDEG